MIPAGAGRHRDHFAIPDLSRASCTSLKAVGCHTGTRSCPRHQASAYAQESAHRAPESVQAVRHTLGRWATARPSGASWIREAIS